MSDNGKRAGDTAKYWLGIAKDSFFFLAIVWQLATVDAEFDRAQKDIELNKTAITALAEEKASLTYMQEKTETNFRRTSNALDATDNLRDDVAQMSERIARMEERHELETR